MEVRPAAREQLRAAEEVRLATWRVAYRGIVPDEHLDALTVTDERVRWLEERYDERVSLTKVALDGDQVVGMAVHGPCRDPDRDGEQELYALYVLPAYWGTAVGQTLWDACQPVTSLWVLADNTRARRFYERQGLHPDATQEIVIGVPLVEVRYVLA